MLEGNRADELKFKQLAGTAIAEAVTARAMAGQLRMLAWMIEQPWGNA